MISSERLIGIGALVVAVAGWRAWGLAFVIGTVFGGLWFTYMLVVRNEEVSQTGTVVAQAMSSAADKVEGKNQDDNHEDE